ncbi:hypothetical protein LOTGIDRAFT_157909 [Lottia gigantea]|uniref:Cytochrome c oxidase subunit 5A, mitochondrial n=1 Tax=Lottia gigantea TaxID=225164 RepID=V4ATK3_LOTGI|nr:hypothetical protein LOTGIDRAFT_157909 [Lottia gigantea]ESP00628.1 hypothetical protein LOTGIDRAFT_157909 [Lottia gigantea]
MFGLARRAGAIVANSTRRMVFQPAPLQVTSLRLKSNVDSQIRKLADTEDGLEGADLLNFRALENSDSWLTRKVFSEIAGYDSIPDPKVMVAGLVACRRLNDYALAIRFIENIHHKAQGFDKNLWAYIQQEITPAMQELGISSLEEMGYEKPEKEVVDVFDMKYIIVIVLKEAGRFNL